MYTVFNKIDFTSLCVNGERIQLRSLNEKYATDIFREFTPEITHYMMPKSADDISETMAFINISQQGMKNGNDLVFVILNKNTEEFLGCCGLHGRSGYQTPELGIWLKKSAHGNKYGREAIVTLVNWAISNMHIDYFIYPVDRANISSRKIAEFLGGIIYQEKKVQTMSGSILDEVVYKLKPT
ncbi:GNAT family N-acetyltransferase [Candidatus Uabimicrobium sp. HlEnr_7]|uniref:GNAT family N-acetyltransferase n=1 Tax=Candidatus Uabimicrobium helgolandensis TaxID=3095367 RepID=UPI0035566D06